MILEPLDQALVLRERWGLRWTMRMAALLAWSAFCVGDRLPAQRPPDLNRRIREALDRSRPLLLDELEKLNQGQLALACHALLNDGVTMEEPRLAAAIQRLSEARLSRCYALGLRLMVIQELRSYPHRLDAAKKDCKALLISQARNGGFSYSLGSGWQDLSNTQYAALGLRAAASLGVKIPKRRWTRLASYALRLQKKNGGGVYRKGSRVPSASMTVALIAVLEICRPHLHSGKTLHYRAKKGVASAWNWMREHSRSIGTSPSASMSSYYYHYGLERAAILSSVIKVGDVDWYLAGAQMMLKQQSERGDWGTAPLSTAKATRGSALAAIDSIPTSFAILFLRRRFQRRLGAAITKGNQIRALFLPKGASKAAIEASVRGEIERGYRAVPGLIKALSSQYLARRQAAVKAFIQITGRFEDLSPYVKPKDNTKLLYAIESWWMREGRKHLDK